MTAPKYQLKLKVCGMKYAGNLAEIALIKPEFLGFIFYENSPRYMAESLIAENLNTLPDSIQKVGVFVNASYQFILEMTKRYELDLVQLHGGEEVDFCFRLKAAGIKIIKVFHVDNAIDLDLLKTFQQVADYFLFDTKSKLYGGTGTEFNWQALDQYNLATPYFLSGGVGLDNIENLKQLTVLPYALDVNSKFEIKPGFKNVKTVRQLKEKMASTFNTH